MPRCEMCGEWPDCPWKTDPEIMCGEYHPKPQTNADRIRGMSDEELAELFKSPLFFNKPWCCLHENSCRHLDSMEFKCAECLFDWLRQEVKE